MPNPLRTFSEYLVDREALLIQIDMSDYLIEYYLHRKQFAPQTTPEHDHKLKELIACFAMHLTARPPKENHAWTLHLIAEQPFSLFVTGSVGRLDSTGAGHGTIVGHVLTDNIRHTDVNTFHAQFTDTFGTPFKSYVRSESADITGMVEHFYKQSEQNQIRIQHSASSDISLGLAALPGWDPAWHNSADLDKLVHGDETRKKRMRSCTFDFECDCSAEKLMPFFLSLTEEAITELYGKDEELIITCPRCGRMFTLHRSEIVPIQ